MIQPARAPVNAACARSQWAGTHYARISRSRFAQGSSPTPSDLVAQLAVRLAKRPRLARRRASPDVGEAGVRAGVRECVAMKIAGDRSRRGATANRRTDQPTKQAIVDFVASATAQVHEWMKTVRQPELGVRYVELVYQPMLELFACLKAREFRVFAPPTRTRMPMGRSSAPIGCSVAWISGPASPSTSSPRRQTARVRRRQRRRRHRDAGLCHVLDGREHEKRLGHCVQERRRTMTAPTALDIRRDPTTRRPAGCPGVQRMIRAATPASGMLFT